MRTSSPYRLALVTVGTALALLAWDLAGLDLPLARWFGDPTGFALRDQWLLTQVLHDGGRRLAWAMTIGLCLMVWWPVGMFRRLDYRQRLQLVTTTLLSALLISTLKSASGTSCPWDMSEFGGVARYASHWTHLWVPDGGSGRCFPAGHASAGFSFVGGYFVFRQRQPALARRWLLAALAAGLLLGLGQQLRGAHFMSHTLWTGWACWCAAWAINAAWASTSGRFPAEPTVAPR